MGDTEAFYQPGLSQLQVTEPQFTPASGCLLPGLLGSLLALSAEKEWQVPEPWELTLGARNLKTLPSPVLSLLFSPSFTRASLSHIVDQHSPWLRGLALATPL